ncbi:MAG: superinfection immunity protein [Clostridia bacterium]
MEVMSLTLLIVLIIILIVGGIVLYFLPAIIAYKRNHANKGIILLIDFLLGWTFLGWAGCIVWAFIDTDGSKASSITRNIGGNKYEDLARLQKLKESGAITNVEFEVEKQKLLR